MRIWPRISKATEYDGDNKYQLFGNVCWMAYYGIVNLVLREVVDVVKFGKNFVYHMLQFVPVSWHAVDSCGHSFCSIISSAEGCRILFEKHTNGK